MQLETLPKFKKLYNLSDIFSVVPIFLVIVMVLNGFFFSFAQVDGVSMEPTFCNSDIVIIKYVSDYDIQDIVILEENNMYLIKRLIAKPGDKLLVDSTGVYVNDILVENTLGNGSVGYSEMIIPDGFYYVMGDNRVNSQDSRFFGLVNQEDMYGQVVLKLSGSTCALD